MRILLVDIDQQRSAQPTPRDPPGARWAVGYNKGMLASPIVCINLISFIGDGYQFLILTMGFGIFRLNFLFFLFFFDMSEYLQISNILDHFVCSSTFCLPTVMPNVSAFETKLTWSNEQ